jgi:RHH-type proline utilization regulon transcriptional repressor/proline dehydrogenase/delta 1-pyrroline-5-carboxylate dehydrogenase
MTVALGSAVDTAAALARRWATATGPGDRHDAAGARLAALVADPAGLDLAVRFVDRVVRPEDPRVAARELAALRAADAGDALSRVDRLLLGLGTLAAPVAPAVVVPAARARLRALVGHLVADAGPGLGAHLAAIHRQGFRTNLNLLGEAVLGEREAIRRLQRVQTLAARRDVDHVSVKVSAVASRLSPWALPQDAERVRARLHLLAASAARSGTALTVDMEEYQHLHLTLEAFCALLDDPVLRDARLGLALQAYLPDAHAALDTVTEAARRRVAAGGAPVTVRLVKGANLPMEQVEAELHGWAPAPYPSKADTDASYVRLLDRALDPARTPAVRVAVASHNLFHVAYAHVLATDRGVADAMHVEMLLGMAPAQARAVLRDVGTVRLYTPVVAREDWDVAIAYLVRRLEETAAEQNFLRGLLAGGPAALDAHEAAFRASVRHAETVSTTPRRGATLAREALGRRAAEGFANVPDTDPADPAAHRWAAEALASPPRPPLPRPLASVTEVDDAVGRAVRAAASWAATPPAARAAVLRRAAEHLEARRADLVSVMAHEAGKTVAEADPEVSEAVDFARYYAERALELADGAVPGARFTPSGVTVVTPPWNFPVAIPLGSVLAALAAGSPVLVKPAPQTPRCASVAFGAVRAALADLGAPPDALQVVAAPEDEVGRRLVTHPAVARVLLTGSIETAALFAGWREDLEVLAETSGKNAIVVTPSADLDLAVADVVRSAFGHAGQKCSAASLLILVGSVGRSARFRRQLADAVRSLVVGPATDLGTTMGPLVEPVSGKLLRALTTLDEGEAWLVRPRRLDETGRLWTPGVKHGVRPGSFFHLTECFGPVLGVMRARDLAEAVAWQNAVPFGLTGGLHSLDEDEIAFWLDRVEVGNAYVNRHTTGAVVRRQPFGGWKASVVGPGAKAGGPHYVAQLGTWADGPEVPPDDDAWLAWAREDDRRWWDAEIGRGHDPSGLRGEENVLRYRPVPHLVVRVGDDARPREVARVLAAAELAGVPVTVSRADDEDHATFAARVASGEVSGRVRAIGTCPGLRAAARTRVGEVTLLDGPVLASGRRELLTVVREQAVSRTRHRFGHVTERR